MDKAKARQILPLINNPDAQKLLELIYEIESESIIRSISSIADDTTLRMMQGKLQQLERLKQLRDRVIEAAKNG
jgi:hypothetical protein